MALAGEAAARDFPVRHNLPPGPRPVPVQASFFLSDINRIDDQQETFEMKGLLKLQWVDRRQAFDPAEAGVDRKLYQGVFQFLEIYQGWWPQLVLANGTEQSELAGTALKIEPDGTMLFIQEVAAVVKSPMDLRSFPFDRQQLRAIFEPLAAYGTEVELVTGPGMTDLPERHIRVAGWELRELSAETHLEHDAHLGTRYSQLIVTLDMARRPQFTIWFIVVPLSLIVLLSMSIFWMDRESLGSRMDISFIALLTIVAYQSLVETSLPKIAYFTMMSGFVYTAYLTMTASILANIAVDLLNRRGRVVAADRLDETSRWAFPSAFLGLNLLSGLYFYVL